jgi:hypothetical protein
MATKSSNDYNLDDVNDVAMMTLNIIIQTRELPPRNAKRGSKWTRDRHATRIKTCFCDCDCRK